MRSITTYDYPAIARNMAHRSKGEFMRAMRVLRFTARLVLFGVTTALCLGVMCVAMGFYGLGRMVVPPEIAERSRFLE